MLLRNPYMLEHHVSNYDMGRIHRTRSIESVSRTVSLEAPLRAVKGLSMKLLPSISPTQRSPNPPQRSPTLRPRGNHGTNNNSSTKSTPSLPLPSSIVQREEEALERELEIWISQHQHTLQPLHHHQQPTPNVTSSFNRQKSQQVNPFELHIPLHTSQLHNGTLRQMAKQHPKQERSLMDEPGTEESNHFEAAAHPQHINHAYNAKTLGRDAKNHLPANLQPPSTFPRCSLPTPHAYPHYSTLSLPRNFHSIPAIKPISISSEDQSKDYSSKHISMPPSPHISMASARRKSIIPDPNHETSPLYFINEEDGKEYVLGGTLSQFVNSLTDERADQEFMEDFLYTYRYFTTAEKFLEELQRRYLYAAPLSCTAQEKALYDEWRGPVQLRVINCLKKWIEEHFHDFELEPTLLDKVRTFIFSTISLQNSRWATALDEIIYSQLIRFMNIGDRAVNTEGLDPLQILCALLKKSDLVQNRKWRLKNYKNCFVGQEAVDWMMANMGLKSRQMVCNFGSRLVDKDLIVCISKEKKEFRDTQHSYYQFTPKMEELLAQMLPSPPILPKKDTEINLSNVDAKEMARQLTLIEFNIFKTIKTHEISFQAWAKNKNKDSINVSEMINRFNEVGYWVATEVLSQKQITTRAAVLKKLIEIAHACKKMNNFNTMMEIAVGLNMGAVARLVKTWAALDSKTKARYDEIMELTHQTHNFKNYRELLKTATLPALPYLALILKDLTFIEDGNKNYLEEAPTNINFHKMRMLAKTFKSVTLYQRNPYNITPVPQIQEYLLGVHIEQNTDEMYRLSCLCEPSRNSVKLSAANGT